MFQNLTNNSVRDSVTALGQAVNICLMIVVKLKYILQKHRADNNYNTILKKEKISKTKDK